MKTKKLFVAHCRAFLCCSAIAILSLACGRASAQTVSISPKTGNVVSAASYDQESHIRNYGGVWIHDQLPLTLLTSDEATLTDDGLVKVHANNVGVEEGKLGLISGHGSIKNHMTLSLPKGYRFTSYKIVLNYETWHNNNNAVATTFRETKNDFSTNYASVQVKVNAKKVTLTRTSLSGDDMGNILYFLQDHTNGHATVSVESFTITFECTDKFDEILRPDVAKLTKPVACIDLPFQTARVDLGTITRQTVNNYTSYKYNYNNVKDLQADFLFYDESGIVGGTAVSGTQGNGTIQALVNTGERTFLGLKNSTYWLEVPTDALAQDGTTRIPVGYRIVGARVVYSNSVDPDIKPGDDIYITDGNGRYMNASLQFTTTKVVWKYGTDKSVSTVSGKRTVYLRHQSSWLGGLVSLETTTISSQATAYETDGLNLYYGSNSRSYVISCGADGKAAYNVANSYAVVANASPSVSNTSFTLKLYDKTGNNVERQATVSASQPSGDLMLERLNNDAIKLQVEGLQEGELAYVCLEVQLEALNPYVDKMDIACTQVSGEKKLKNQYLADDFTIGTGGKVDFSVPTNFATTGLRFNFEGLHSKNADETYPDGTVGEYSRYHFVRSAYYDLIGENLQGHREAAADHSCDDKLAVSVAGDQAFICNNSDNFKAGTSGDGTFVYEENRYSNEKYGDQGGRWTEMEANNGDDYVKRFLIVCDETRYNIAPTTTPRHAYYAYYSTDLRLTTVDYKPVLTYTPVYHNAVIPSGPDDNAYVGVSVSLTDADDNPMPEGVGYVYAKQVIDQINEDIQAKKLNAPVDAKHILYFDASKINSLLFSTTDPTWGNLQDLQAELGQNALVFLPEGVTDNHDNVASRSVSGDDFVAENNIVLTDQWPFFSPYDIRVNAANEVSYDRMVTPDKNTKKWVTIVLPFTIAVDPETGSYEQPADESVFTFYKMAPTNTFSPRPTGDLTFSDDEIDGHFSAYKGQTVTQPNEAYVVRIDQTATSADAPSLLFRVRQRGATIARTPVTAAAPTIVGDESTGTVGTSQMTLTSMATYGGANIPVEQGVFYFNKDKFVSSLNVKDRFSSIYVLPFRSYYASASTSARSVRYIHISTEPTADPTGIDTPAADAPSDGFVCSAQAGQLVIRANRDLRVCIRNLNGQTVHVATLHAGESSAVALPSGIYVVNGVKVAVK